MSEQKVSDDLSKAMLLAKMALTFGRVERSTRHEDGARPETDTDHTVMLGLVACELAPRRINRQRVAAFALVHDLVEVYAGDTQTLKISPEAMAEKRSREAKAQARIIAELGEGSWLAELLTAYEQQVEPEARFVRVIDKIMPKLTHALNGCVSVRSLTDRAGFVESHGRQLRLLREEYPDFPEAIGLLSAAMDYSVECWAESAGVNVGGA